MLSTSTQFARNKNRADAPCHVIVKLTDGASTWYFSDREMNFGTTHIYGGLDAPRDLKRETLDIFTKKWAVASMSVQLSNAPYRKSGATWIRPSEDLAGIQGNEVLVYLLCGYDVATFPDDCLMLFKGDILDPIEVTTSSIKFKVYDKSYKKDFRLPSTVVGDIYSDALAEYAKKKIPIVYGKFNSCYDGYRSLDNVSGYELTFQHDGLAVAVPVSADDPPKYVIADHVVHAIGTALNNSLGGPNVGVYVTDPTGTLDDSGRGTYILPISYKASWLNFFWYPKAYYGSGDNDEGDEITAMSPENIWDANQNTKATVYDTRDDLEPDPVLFGKFQLLFDYGDWAMGVMDTKYGTGYMMFLLKTGAGTNVNGETATISFCVVKENYPNQDIVTTLKSSRDTAVASVFEADSNDFEIMPANSALQLYSSDVSGNAPNLIRIYITETRDTECDGITLNYDLLQIASILIQLSCDCRENFKGVFAEVDGMEYGSWITSRSSNYASGDCIEDPAGIIESMLRTFLGMANDDLDLTSFIDAENTSVKARINLHDENAMMVTDAIRQLAEQSTFAYFFGAVGKAKLIPLNDETPTTMRTIKWWDVIDGNIKITKSDHWVKQLNVNSRYQQEYGDLYRDYDEYSNSGSGSNVAWEVKWPNINGTSAQHVARHLVKKADGSDSNGNGIWAHQHNIIEFETPYFMNADLEIGDWIEIDSNTADLHLKCFDESWSGKQFLVIGLEQSIDATTITAIELF